MAQYAVLLTFSAALMISAGVGDGLSDDVIGMHTVVLSLFLVVSICIFGVLFIF